MGILLASVLSAERLIGWTLEDGWIETLSEWFYLAPIGLLILGARGRGDSLSASLRWPLVWIFLFMMLREQDVQRIWGAHSWMRLSFYASEAPLHQKLFSCAALAGVLAAMAWVVWRGAGGWWSRLRGGEPDAWTIGVFLFMLTATKIADRAPNILYESFGWSFAPGGRAFVSFFEEAGEFTLPVLAAWAILQARGLLGPKELEPA